MKKTILVVMVLAITLVLGSLAVSASQAQIGNKVFAGNNLAINLTVIEDNFYGSVNLPCSGYLYVFYQGNPGENQYMIFPNPQSRWNYVKAGLNVLPLSMLYPTGKSQKLTVLFSPFKLLEVNFCQSQDPFLLTSSLGPWCNVCNNSIWIGQKFVPKGPTKTSSQTSTNCRRPAPVPTCYTPHPVRTSCCPSPCAVAWWWLMMGIIIAH